MNEEEVTVEPEPVKTELLVEQSDLDKVFSFPVFGQIENVEKNTTEMLLELKKLNEYLIPTEEEQAEMSIMATEEPVVEEPPAEEPVVEEPVEEEVVIDYDPLVLEQLEILNAHMEVSQELQEKGHQISAEMALTLVVTIAIAIALKVFVEQITKW